MYHINALFPKKRSISGLLLVVPYCNYDKDPKLGHWVGTQRRRCRGKERVMKLLNDINFIWSVSRIQ